MCWCGVRTRRFKLSHLIVPQHAQHAKHAHHIASDSFPMFTASIVC